MGRVESRILRLERTYRQQMLEIRQLVEEFGAERGWQPLRRGRHAHASLFGQVNDLSGVLDIEMVFDDWEACPDRLEESTPFHVFAAVFMDTANGRFHDRQPFRRSLTFRKVQIGLSHLLDAAWEYLSSRTKSDVTEGPTPLAGV